MRPLGFWNPIPLSTPSIESHEFHYSITWNMKMSYCCNVFFLSLFRSQIGSILLNVYRGGGGVGREAHLRSSIAYSMCAFLCQLYSFTLLNIIFVRARFYFLCHCVCVCVCRKSHSMSSCLYKSSPTKTNQSHVDFHFSHSILFAFFSLNYLISPLVQL